MRDGADFYCQVDAFEIKCRLCVASPTLPPALFSELIFVVKNASNGIALANFTSDYDDLPTGTNIQVSIDSSIFRSRVFRPSH